MCKLAEHLIGPVLCHKTERGVLTRAVRWLQTAVIRWFLSHHELGLGDQKPKWLVRAFDPTFYAFMLMFPLDGRSKDSFLYEPAHSKTPIGRFRLDCMKYLC